MISIIIPTYNEEKIIEKRLKSLLKLSGDYEIIVADSSDDNTYEVAKKYVKVVRSEKGRGVQMNKGAREAKGDILLFLHLDTLLRKGSLERIDVAIKNDYVGGRFVLNFNSTKLIFRFISFFTKSDIFRLYYGDQAFFCRKDVFEKINGYKDVKIMEDIDFYNRLRKKGKVKVIKEPVVTSSRRLLQGGITKTLILMSFLKFFYAIGLDDKKLKRFYLEIR